MSENKDLFRFFKEKNTYCEDDMKPKRAAPASQSVSSSSAVSSNADSDQTYLTQQASKKDAKIVSPPALKKKKIANTETVDEPVAITATATATATTATATVTTTTLATTSSAPSSGGGTLLPEEETMRLLNGGTFWECPSTRPLILVHKWTAHLKNKGYIKKRHGMIYQMMLEYCQGILDLLHDKQAHESSFYPRTVYREYEKHVSKVKKVMYQVAVYRDFCLDIVDEDFILRYINEVDTKEMAQLVKRLITCRDYELTFEPFPSLGNFRIGIQFSHVQGRAYYPARDLVDYSTYSTNY